MRRTIKRVRTNVGKVDRQIAVMISIIITMIVIVPNWECRQSPESTTQNSPQYVTRWQPVEHLFTNSCITLPKKVNLRDLLKLS